MAIELISLVTPIADLTAEARQNVVRQAISMAERGAVTHPAFRSVPLVVRHLAGNDFGLTPHTWQETTTATLGTGNTFENSAVNGTTARDRYIAVYGCYVASSVDSVASLRFVVGGRRTHQWDLQSVISSKPMDQSREQRTLYCYARQDGTIDPVLVPPLTSILIQHYVRGGTSQGAKPVEIVYLGVALEPFGGGGAELQPDQR